MKKSIQDLAENMYKSLKIGQYGRESLVLNGMFGTKVPILIHPFRCNSERLEIGVYRGPGGGSTTFYLFDSVLPYHDNKVLFELKTGEWVGPMHKRKYRNTYNLRISVSGPAENKFPLAIATVMKEMNHLLYASHTYLLDEEIEEKYIIKIPRFNEDDYNAIKR